LLAVIRGVKSSERESGVSFIYPASSPLADPHNDEAVMD